MNLRDLARRIFGGTSGLRNRPGGLAMIRCPLSDAACVLNGHVVQTVRADADGFWKVEPQQVIPADGKATLDARGSITPAGQPAVIEGMSDDCLIPLRAPGEKERSEELAWKPKVPAPGKVAA